MANILKFLRGLAANRTSKTPAVGEPLWVTDDKLLYVGDGTTAGGIRVSTYGWDWKSGLEAGFHSLGIDDNATQEVFELVDSGVTLGINNTGGFTFVRQGTTGNIGMKGGSGLSAGLNMFGSSHGSAPMDIQFTSNGISAVYFDQSASTWDFQANDLTTTGSGVFVDGLFVGGTSEAATEAYILTSATGTGTLNFGDTAFNRAQVGYDHSLDEMFFNVSLVEQLRISTTEIDCKDNDITTTGDATAATFTSTVASGTAPFTVASNTKVTNLNADLLDGYNYVSSSAAVNSVVGRNVSGDIYARLFRSTYQNQTTMTGGLCFRVSTTDNYIRTCTDPEPIRTFLHDDEKIDNHTALSNLQYRGKVVTRLASGTVTAGYAVEEVGDATWPRVRHADADNISMITGVAITGATTGNYVDVLIYGTIKLTGGHYTVGAKAHAYASNTAGYITPTPSSTAGDYIKVIGYGLDTDVLFVNPTKSWLEI